MTLDMESAGEARRVEGTAEQRRQVRKAALASTVGTTIELLLLKHTEGYWQILPLVLMGLALALLVVHAVAPSASTVRVLQAVMALFLLSGAVGILLHYRGNAEWELERMASLSGFDLFKHAVMGATPTLAPGTMVQLGLVGLLYTYRHPAARRRPTDPSSNGNTT